MVRHGTTPGQSQWPATGVVSSTNAPILATLMKDAKSPSCSAAPTRRQPKPSVDAFVDACIRDRHDGGFYALGSENIGGHAKIREG